MEELESDPANRAQQRLLSLRNVRKAYGGVNALINGQLDLYQGVITALIGENGAGKSTLVKILTGVIQPDSGEITIDGQHVTITSPIQAQRLGISVIHQESIVFNALTVAENIFISDRPHRFGLVDWPAMRTKASALLSTLGIDLDVDRTAGSLSIAQKNLVQIARALSGPSRIVIMDEPTAALSHHEAMELFRIVRQLRDEGRAILFIGHKFEELYSLADRFVVFRDGAAVAEGDLTDISQDQLISEMVGRQINSVYPPVNTTLGKEALSIEGLSRPPEFKDISFSVRSGEILGIYGLVGAGRSEVLQAIFGLKMPATGRIVIDGKTAHIRSPADAIALGLALVPEDRQHQGAILELTITDNVSLANLNRLGWAGFIGKRKEQMTASPLLAALQVKSAGTEQRVGDLSGGNQQKVVLAKWLATKPKVLFLDEPTKGIDVGAKIAVHQWIRAFVQQGFAIVMISSDLTEVLGMSNRILVMNKGRTNGCFRQNEASPELILRAAAGG